MALQNAEHFFAQVCHIGVYQTRVTDHATPQIIGRQAFGRALEQGCAQRRFNFVQRFGRAGLGNCHRLGGLVQRAKFVQRNQQPQLFEAQAGNDGGQGWQHGDDYWLSLNQHLSLGSIPDKN